MEDTAILEPWMLNEVDYVDDESVRSEDTDNERACNRKLLFSIDEIPPWHLCIVLSLQHYLTMFGGTLSVSIVIASAICVGDDTLVTSEILGTLLFVTGIVTMLQTTVGIRLPIVQGAPFSFVVSTFVIMSLEKWKCPNLHDSTGEAINNMTDIGNEMSAILVGSDEHKEEWQKRMREVQGAIILASLFQVLIGLTGLVGFLLRFIGPLTVVPVIALVGMSLFKHAGIFCSSNWWLAMLTIILIAISSQYLSNLRLPFYKYERASGSCIRTPGFSPFKLFPVILSILLTWFLCWILTKTNAVPNDPAHWAYRMRIDTSSDVLMKAKWFRVPYPGQWGVPTFSTGSVLGMLAAVLAGIIESIGDYYACARACGAPPPPVHAVNRGVFVEGLGCLLAGAWGTGSGTTSFSENIGAIALTRVGSRRVVQVGALIMMLLGILGKFGALFVTIPAPIIAGVFVIMFSMITAVGISNIQYVDMNSSRNLYILGLSMMFGLALPQWLTENPGAIHTGHAVGDQILTVLLSTGMFVGGAIGALLDNTIPGSDAERGLLLWRKQLGDADDIEDITTDFSCYDIPFISRILSAREWTSFIPISPTFLRPTTTHMHADNPH